jgi:sulfatase modifying factor 1
MLTELVELPGGSFRMGSVQFYPEEAPVHTVDVTAFAIERHPVTNAQFAEFVAYTGYLTVAEQDLDPALYPGVAPQDLVPGALVFRPTRGPVDLRDWRQWWEWVPGACWRHPFGPDSGSDERLDHPVGQVA